MILRQLIELLEEDMSFTLYYADTLEPIEEITGQLPKAKALGLERVLL